MAAGDRLQAPAAARLLEAVLDQLPVGVVVVDAPSRRVTLVSERARRLLGMPLEADGVEDYERFPLRRPDGGPVESGRMPLARAVRDGETVRNELYEYAAPDGQSRLLSISAAPVEDEDGAIVAAVSVFDDVTERIRSARAEREFIANAAHELRTPLAAITSAIEVLQLGAKHVPEERDVFLDHIQRETRRIARLAHALFLIARAQTNAERPRVALVPLRPLLDDVAAATMPAEGVALTVRCPSRLAALANRDLLEQALLNLAQNAARYSSGGSIALRARAKSDVVAVEVVDEGPGFEPDSTSHRFSRGGRGEGYGLGLSIVRQAVDAMDARLEVESAPGRGTTARILVPLARLVETKP